MWQISLISTVAPDPGLSSQRSVRMSDQAAVTIDWTQAGLFGMKDQLPGMGYFERTEEVMAREKMGKLSENENSLRIIEGLINHTALPACETRADIELLVHSPIPDTLWEKFEKWSADRGVNVGEALWQQHNDLVQEHVLKEISPRFDAIFFDKDGNRRPDANQRLDLAVEMIEAEKPEMMARYRTAIELWVSMVPEDASHEELEKGMRAFLAGLSTARISRAHVALAQLRTCPGMSYFLANAR